jgi:hypothetical protein
MRVLEVFCRKSAIAALDWMDLLPICAGQSQRWLSLQRLCTCVPDVVPRDEGDQVLGMGVDGVDFGVWSRVWDILKDLLNS